MIRTLLLTLCLPLISLAQTPTPTPFVVDGRVGIGTNDPQAVIDFEILQPDANDLVFRWPNHNGAPDWGMAMLHTPNVYAQGFEGSEPYDLKYYSMFFGYNVGVNGGRVIANDHQFGVAIETPYWTQEGGEQTEFYLFAGARGAGFNGYVPPVPYNFRPFGITMHHGEPKAGQLPSRIEINSRADSFSVGAQERSGWNDWFSIQSTLTSGELNLGSDSGINYGGTREWFLKADGIKMLAKPTNSVMKIFGGSGYSGSEASDKIIFFDNDIRQSTNMALCLGKQAGDASRCLQWKAWASPAGRWEFQDYDGNYRAPALLNNDGKLDTKGYKVNGVQGVTVSGSSCVITNISSGIITGAVCTP